MKSKEGRPYWLFLKEYAFKKKLFPFYLLTIVIIVLTAGVSLVRPELQGKVVDDLGNPQILTYQLLCSFWVYFWECCYLIIS